MSKEKVLITGGSGFIGTTAVSYALQHGWQTVNVDIRPPNLPEHRDVWRNVDVRDRDAMSRVMREFRPSYILHLAAKTGMDLVSMDQLTTNTDGVRTVVECAAEVPDVRRVVFVSSLLVCRNGYIPAHDQEYCAPNLYGKSKVIGEQIVREAQVPYQWAIVRPTSVWGPWFEHSYRAFFRTIHRGYYVHPGKDDITKPKTYVGNTVHMIYRILLGEDPGINHGTYYLSDWPETTTREWAGEIARQLDRPRIRTVPVPALRVLAAVGDVAKHLGKEIPLTSFRLNNMLTGGSYPTANTQQVVGHLPFTLEEGVRETVTWMRAQNLL